MNKRPVITEFEYGSLEDYLKISGLPSGDPVEESQPVLSQSLKNDHRPALVQPVQEPDDEYRLQYVPSQDTQEYFRVKPATEFSTVEKQYIESPQKKESPAAQWPVYSKRTADSESQKKQPADDEIPYMKKTQPIFSEKRLEKDRIVPSEKIARTKSDNARMIESENSNRKPQNVPTYGSELQTPSKRTVQFVEVDQSSRDKEVKKEVVDRSVQTPPQNSGIKTQSPTLRDAQTEHNSLLSMKDSQSQVVSVRRESEKLRAITFSPPKQNKKLTQHSTGYVEVRPSKPSAQNSPQRHDELQDAREFLYKSKDEELKEKTQRIETLKETNGKVALRYLLASFELMRLDSSGASRESRQSPRESSNRAQQLTIERLQGRHVRGITRSSVSKSSIGCQTTATRLSSSCDSHEAEIRQLQAVNSELKDIIVKNAKSSSKSQQPSSQSSELARLRHELIEVRKQLEEQEWDRESTHKLQESHEIKDLREQLRQANSEIERIKNYWQRDKGVIRDMNEELKQALAEIDNQKSYNLTQHQIREAEKAQLLSKLAKRDIARKELEAVIDQLQQMKKQSTNCDYTNSRTNEGLVQENRRLKDDLQEAKNELEVLRKLMGKNGKKPRGTPGRGSTPPKISGLSNRDQRGSAGMIDFQDPTHNRADIQTFLLGLEVCRLNFAYGGCRCGNIEQQNYIPLRKTDPVDDSPFRMSKHLTDQTTKKTLQPFSASNYEEENRHLITVTKERDSLKALLADYQKRLLEARRTIDSLRAGQGQKENIPLNQIQIQPEKQSQVQLDDKKRLETAKSQRERELQLKILAAEKALQGPVSTPEHDHKSPPS